MSGSVVDYVLETVRCVLEQTVYQHSYRPLDRMMVEKSMYWLPIYHLSHLMYQLQALYTRLLTLQGILL